VGGLVLLVDGLQESKIEIGGSKYFVGQISPHNPNANQGGRRGAALGLGTTPIVYR